MPGSAGELEPGDPEIVAWGVSMGAALEYGISSEGHPERKDRMITSALFVSAELAESPYETGPVLHWFDVREREKNSGSWPVKTDQERSHWDWSPLKAVGPLRFGMTPRQVADALAGEAPAGRQGHFPYWWWRRGAAGQWTLTDDRFEQDRGDRALLVPGWPPSTGSSDGPRPDRTADCPRRDPSHRGNALPPRRGHAPAHRESRPRPSLTSSGQPVPELQFDINATRAGDTAISEVTFLGRLGALGRHASPHLRLPSRVCA
ncbi:putative protein OS=Streptomyces microflavus OX=1919 GN=Smic_78980 PE=4 SV=1 [Streptomyces microflavus]